MAALEFVMENCGVELEWPCSSPPRPNSSAHCGLDAGDVDDVFAPAKESVTNSEGGRAYRGGCTTAARKLSSEAGQHRIGSGTRRFRTRPLLPKLPIPPCDSGLSFVAESSPLNFTTSPSGNAGGRKRDSDWSQETESRFKRAWAGGEDHSAAFFKKAVNAMGGQEVTLAQVKEYSCKQPPHVRVTADPDSSLGEDVTTRSVEDAACSQRLHEAMAQQMEVMKTVQFLLEDQCQIQAQIEVQHTNLIRMLAASKNTSAHPQPLELTSEEEGRDVAVITPACVGWTGSPRPESITDLDPFRLLEEEHLNRYPQEAEFVPADSIDLQHLLLLHPDLLRHPHFLHQLLALSATTNGTPPLLQVYPQHQAMRQQEGGAVQVSAAHEFQGVGASQELMMQQLQRCLVEEQLKEQIRRQVQMQQMLLYQLAATQQSAVEMPTDTASYLVGNAGEGAGMGWEWSFPWEDCRGMAGPFGDEDAGMPPQSCVD